MFECKCINCGEESNLRINRDNDSCYCIKCNSHMLLIRCQEYYRHYYTVQNQNYPGKAISTGYNENQSQSNMKSDPCDSPTRDARKELKQNVDRSVQIGEWNSCADRVLNTIDSYTSALTAEDKKQIKSRLDNILKLLLSK